MYAVLVAAAGYVPVMLSGEDYIALLPSTWRTVNDYGINLDERVYNCAGLDPLRRQRSGVTARNGQWQVHYDPYDLTVVWVRDHRRGSFIPAPWTHLPMTTAPFADYTWRHAQRLAAERPGTGTGEESETAAARALAALLQTAGDGPDNQDGASRQIAARTRAAASSHRPLLPAPAEHNQDDAEESGTDAVTPFGIFDANTEAQQWRHPTRKPATKRSSKPSPRKKAGGNS